MYVPVAYLAVVLVWSTTPLGVQWSSEGISPVMGALSRMFLAALIGWAAARVMKVAIPWHGKAIRLYAISNIGLFVGLMSVYIGATLIPSGMISVIFGLSPVMSAVLARYLLNEPKFTTSKWVAVSLGMAGLLVTFDQDIQISEQSYLGYGLVVVGALCFSLSGVLIKREPQQLHPMAQTAGSLMMATPLYFLSGLFFGLDVDAPQPRAIAAILYLTVFGSFIGFFCYFYILKHMAASSVALVTLITPVIAISLGVMLNGEALSTNLVIGAAMICSCLLLFYWGDAMVKRLSVGFSN